jgi:hypothetical protein
MRPPPVSSPVNRFLATFPRTTFGHLSREVPAMRTVGVAGYYVAVATTLAGGLLTGRSLLVIAVVCLVCALSFFAYVYVRLWITGRETMVLLDQVWFAEVCVALTLAALGEPVLPYMDIVAVAMCFFLVAGRVGCLMAGCCHGRPSSVGIVYGEEHARAGFPRHLAGVRLFPVQGIEAAGLACIGLSGLVALPVAAPGRVFLWFLCGYGVLRFGLEGLRGDPRMHLLGLSRARWMALAEVGLAVWLARGSASPVRDGALLAVLVAALAAGLAARHAFDPRRRFRDDAHLAELRAMLEELTARPVPAWGTGGQVPLARATSRGVSVATSAAPGERALHVSLSLPAGVKDLELLCELAARSLPRLLPGRAQLLGGGVLHLLVPAAGAAEGDPVALSRELYGSVVRRLQAAPAIAPPELDQIASTLAGPDERALYMGVPVR